ncbi:MAG: tRNA pseudouridine(55) synthase TruB [Oscillospiraceae bacterium]|jgi:tRNA pseudouridine55 synthase|nr:tRNA pseudouridine(55) synthase TruB [Oscillospiraceae bacterium]
MDDGILNLLKPSGMTSSDAVGFVKRVMREAGLQNAAMQARRDTPVKKTKVGHGGTLDPEAAGVLPILIGGATKLFDQMTDKRKTYIGELVFGWSTDTQDAQGETLETSDDIPTEERLLAVLPSFIGEISQVPPKYSALKVNGSAAYDLARSGRDFTLEARRAMVYGIELLDRVSRDTFLLKVECGRGTYIRTLFHDIGRALNCPAHMGFLLRTQAGELTIDEARTPAEIRDEVLGTRY